MPERLLALRDAQRRGEARGICAVCSAHPLVLRAALQEAREAGPPLLIEATCNQVNPEGGYTGMTPADFMAFVHDLALQEGFDPASLILGGDHLGPNPWRKEPAAAALEKAGAMVEAYVAAGFRKLHLDASMACAGDPEPLPAPLIAARAAQLCLRAETVARNVGGALPVYVIGTEVPPPGGAAGPEHGVAPTSSADLLETLAISREAFLAQGLEGAWERVLAVVVQPGVEFGDAQVHAYDRGAAQTLSGTLAGREPWIFEAHSTDYQLPIHLRELVEDRFAILKMGPWLTFACREALFALEEIARELHEADPSRPLPHLRRTLEFAMRTDPSHWEGHYFGSPGERSMACRFSFSDRSRYYWQDPAVAAEVERLLEATRGPLPLPLLSQYLPQALEPVLAGALPADGRSLVTHAVRRVLHHYAQACTPGSDLAHAH
jgi:D-tagatose-1,6-bisphosphate aldolase subunit GatZ/KbaZ